MPKSNYNVIQVALYATGGVGSSGSPWTGWDTAITWSADTEYYFQAGYYSYATSPNFLQPGIALVGSGGTILKHTGSGNAFIMDAGSTPGSTWIQNVRVENLVIYGNSNSDNGMFLRGVRNGRFKHILVKDVPNAALWTEGCVTNVLDNFRCTYHEPTQAVGWVVRPKWGIVTTGRGGDYSTCWTILNPVIENLSEKGIWFKSDSYGNNVIGGTSEGHIGSCVGVLVEGSLHTFIGTDVEANASLIDFDVKGTSNQFLNCLSDQLFHVTAGQRHRVHGGTFKDITIDASIDLAEVSTVYYTGTFTNSSLSTLYYGNQGVSPGLDYRARVGTIIPKLQAISSSSGTLSTNAINGNVTSTPIENITVANPTNPINGQTLSWRLTSGGAGSWTLAFGNKFRFLVTAPTALGATGNMTYFSATYNSQDDKWDVTSAVQTP